MRRKIRQKASAEDKTLEEILFLFFLEDFVLEEEVFPPMEFWDFVVLVWLARSNDGIGSRFWHGESNSEVSTLRLCLARGIG